MNSRTQIVLSCCPDPATLEKLGTIPEMGLAETKEAIQAASKAFASWSVTSPKVTNISFQSLIIVTYCNTSTSIATTFS